MGRPLFIKSNARHETVWPALHTRCRGQVWGWRSSCLTSFCWFQFLWCLGCFSPQDGWLCPSMSWVSERVQMGLFWDAALWTGTSVMLREGWPLLLLTASPTTGFTASGMVWAGRKPRGKEGFSIPDHPWPFLPTPFYLICTCSPRKPPSSPDSPQPTGEKSCHHLLTWILGSLRI